LRDFLIFAEEKNNHWVTKTRESRGIQRGGGTGKAQVKKKTMGSGAVSKKKKKTERTPAAVGKPSAEKKLMKDGEGGGWGGKD